MHQPGAAEKKGPSTSAGRGLKGPSIVTNGVAVDRNTLCQSTFKYLANLRLKLARARPPERLAVLHLGVFRILRFL